MLRFFGGEGIKKSLFLEFGGSISILLWNPWYLFFYLIIYEFYYKCFIDEFLGIEC